MASTSLDSPTIIPPPPRLELRLEREGAPGVTLTIVTSVVLYALDGATMVSQDFEEPALAMVVFEANVSALEADGYAVTDARCDETLPGSLGDIGCDDDRSFIRIEDDRLVAAEVYEADPVSVYDGLEPSVRSLDPFGRFDPATAECAVTLARHALRRLAAHPSGRTVPRLGLALWGPWCDPLLDATIALGLADRVTHAELWSLWDSNRGRSFMAGRALGDEFPRLMALGVPFWAWPSFARGRYPRLDRLRLEFGPHQLSANQASPDPVDLVDALDGVQRAAPELRALAIPHRRWDARAIEVLAGHPAVERLIDLDLFGLYDYFDADALFAQRPRLAHLDRIVLGSHGVARGTYDRFAGWPQVTFASHTRAEVADFDREWRERVTPR